MSLIGKIIALFRSLGLFQVKSTKPPKLTLPEEPQEDEML